MIDRAGFIAGLLATGLLAAGIVLGSRSLRTFDPVLLTYTFGVIFAVFAVAYRTAVWLRRPPTRLCARRGWQLLWTGNPFANLAFTGTRAATQLGAQRFILKRGRLRWLTHALIAWGSLLAGAVTFPLVFGWLHFATNPDEPHLYRVMLFGVQALEFSTRSVARLVLFNLLNLSAVMVIVGVSLALHRRLRDPAALSRQQFGNDLVPLLLLLAISVTGLMLTFSMHALQGAGYTVLSLIHAVTVCAALLYAPFGKLFHVVQRPLHLSVMLCRRAGEKEAPRACRRCGEGYASAMQVEDLKLVTAECGFELDLELCPACKRRQIGVAHRLQLEKARG
jgi:hypothetical protein